MRLVQVAAALRDAQSAGSAAHAPPQRPGRSDDVPVFPPAHPPAPAPYPGPIGNRERPTYPRFTGALSDDAGGSIIVIILIIFT